jgi:XapX domain-containing protein
MTRTTAAQFTISLGIGVVVGLGYGMLRVRSPAPPPVALVGLLGMLVGQQVISWLSR